MDDFAAHADSITQLTAAPRSLDALFASFDGQVPARHAAAGRTASTGKVRR